MLVHRPLALGGLSLLGFAAAENDALLQALQVYPDCAVSLASKPGGHVACLRVSEPETDGRPCSKNASSLRLQGGSANQQIRHVCAPT